MGLKEWLIRGFNVPPEGTSSIPSEQSRTAHQGSKKGTLKDRVSRVLQMQQEEAERIKRDLIEKGTQTAQKLTVEAKQISLPFIEAMHQSGIVPILNELKKEVIGKADSRLDASVVITYQYHHPYKGQSETGSVTISPQLPDFKKLIGGVFTFEEKRSIDDLRVELQQFQSIELLHPEKTEIRAGVHLAWDYQHGDHYSYSGYLKDISAIFESPNMMIIYGKAEKNPIHIPRSNWSKQNIEDAVLKLYLETVPKPT